MSNYIESLCLMLIHIMIRHALNIFRGILKKNNSPSQDSLTSIAFINTVILVYMFSSEMSFFLSPL